MRMRDQGIFDRINPAKRGIYRINKIAAVKELAFALETMKIHHFEVK